MLKKQAVVLLSGGVDSSTTMAIAKSQGFDIYAISLDYGQKNPYELESAKKVSAFFQVLEHKIIFLNLRQIGGSALTSDEINVPLDRPEKEISSGIPITYVPARNLIFLSLAVAFAETKNIADIFIGVNAVDFSGYPDCRPDFIRAFEETANLGTSLGVKGEKRIKIHTPLIDLTKDKILEKGLALGVDYALTSSCYHPDSSGFACGRCDSCQIRLRGFQRLGYKDPAKYIDF